MAQRPPRHHKVDPALLEQSARRLGTRCLALMLGGLRDDELWHSYNALRDVLVGLPDYSHPVVNKKAPTPKG